MTIALGVLANNGVALAADTQETEGYTFKGFALKIRAEMTKTNIHSEVNSALALTGAGPAGYLDGIFDEIMRHFHDGQHSKISSLEKGLSDCVSEFYQAHVVPLLPHRDNDFKLIIGAQVEGQIGLWSSESTVLKNGIDIEAVGSGAPYARMVAGLHGGGLDVTRAALLAIRGAMAAKRSDPYCGNMTTVTCITNNRCYDIPWYTIKKAEELFDHYETLEYINFSYILSNRHSSRDSEKMAAQVDEVKKELDKLANEILEDS